MTSEVLPRETSSDEHPHTSCADLATDADQPQPVQQITPDGPSSARSENANKHCNGSASLQKRKLSLDVHDERLAKAARRASRSGSPVAEEHLRRLVETSSPSVVSDSPIPDDDPDWEAEQTQKGCYFSPSGPITIHSFGWFHPEVEKFLWRNRGPTPRSIETHYDPYFGRRVCAAYKKNIEKVKHRRRYYRKVGARLATNAPTPAFFREQFELLRAEEDGYEQESPRTFCINTQPTYENFELLRDPEVNKSELEIPANYDVAKALWVASVLRRNGTTEGIIRQGLPVPPYVPYVYNPADWVKTPT